MKTEIENLLHQYEGKYEGFFGKDFEQLTKNELILIASYLQCERDEKDKSEWIEGKKEFTNSIKHQLNQS